MSYNVFVLLEDRWSLFLKKMLLNFGTLPHSTQLFYIITNFSLMYFFRTTKADQSVKIF